MDVGTPGRCAGVSCGHLPGGAGQAVIEYVILVWAVILGVFWAAQVAHEAFLGQAQQIERHEMVF